MKKTALAVLDFGTSRKFASSSIVCAPGVATFSMGFGFSRGAAGFLKRATWRLAV